MPNKPRRKKSDPVDRDTRFIESWEEMERKIRKLHSLTVELEKEIEKTRALKSRMWPMNSAEHHLSHSDPWPSHPKKKKTQPKKK